MIFRYYNSVSASSCAQNYGDKKAKLSLRKLNTSNDTMSSIIFYVEQKLQQVVRKNLMTY